MKMTSKKLLLLAASFFFLFQSCTDELEQIVPAQEQAATEIKSGVIESTITDAAIADPYLSSAPGAMIGRGSAASSCGSSKTTTYYFYRTSVWSLRVGDVLYVNAAGTYTLRGGNRWFYIGYKSFRVNSNGAILAISDCGFPDA